MTRIREKRSVNKMKHEYVWPIISTMLTIAAVSILLGPSLIALAHWLKEVQHALLGQ